MARRGAANVRPRDGDTASKAWRAAVDRGTSDEARAWEPERWEVVDDVRNRASEAVARGTRPRPSAKPSRRPTSARLSAVEVDRRSRQPVEPRTPIDRVRERVRDASRAYSRERYDEARLLLKPIVERNPTMSDARELLGLSYYRLGRWRDAIRELEAFRIATGSTEQHPVLADSYRALRRFGEAEELWDELRSQSPSGELVAEGRIVAAGVFADRGDLAAAIRLLARSARTVRTPREHHLRTWYALGDLYERAGDIPKARGMFGRVARADAEFGDVRSRLRALA